MKTKNKKIKNKSVRITVVVLLSLLCLCLFGIGLTFSWFTRTVETIGGDLKLGTLRTDLYVYRYDASSDSLVSKLTYEDNQIIPGSDTESSFIIEDDDWKSESLGVSYIKAVNVGTIDSKVFMQFVCSLATDMDIHAFNYTYLRIYDITTDIEGIKSGNNALTAYAKEYYNSYLTDAEATKLEAESVLNNGYVLSQIMQEPKRLGSSDIKTGETRYYRLEYASTLIPDEYLEALRKSMSLDVVFDIQQHNTPEEKSSSGQSVYVDGETSFKDVVNAAGAGDTIILTNDINLTDYNLTITQRINLDLNGFTLHVGGNMAYNFTSYGDCSINIPRTSNLLIDGDFIIDTPSTNFTIEGSAHRGITIGSYKDNSVIGGAFTVNTIRKDGAGFNLNRIGVLKTTGNNTATVSDLTVKSNTSVNIGIGSEINNIYAESGASNIYIINNSSLNKIDVSAMSYRGLDDRQVYIVNNGKFTCTDTAPIILPVWSRGYISSVDEDGNGNYQVNTVVVNNPGRAAISVGVRYPGPQSKAIYTAGTLSDAKTLHLAGEGNDDTLDNIRFWNIDISTENTSDDRVVRVGANDYIVYLYGDKLKNGTDDSVRNRINEFFSDPANSEYASEANTIEKITVRTYSLSDSSGLMKSDDWVYLKELGGTLRALDLSGAAFEGGKIPDQAMLGSSVLNEVSFPTVEPVSIGSEAFKDTDLHFVTLYPNITSIGKNAFSAKTESAYSAYCFIKWMGGSAPSDSVLAGFSTDKNILFMEEALLNGFRALKTAWANYSYELYDYIYKNNLFFKKISSNEARYIYYHGTMANCEGNGSAILPYESSDGNRIYITTSIGNGAFRRAISVRENDTSYSYKYVNIIMPEKVAKICDYAFYGAKIESISLNNVKSIGSYAFASCHIKNSTARPNTFKGMESLGEYVFKGTTIGFPAAVDFDNVSQLVSQCITFTENGKFTDGTNRYNYNAGILDLHGDFDVVSGNTFRDILFIGVEVDLSGIHAFYAEDYKANASLKNPFSGTKFYGCTLSLKNVGLLGSKLLYDKWNHTKTSFGLYSNLDISNVKVIETNLCYELSCYSLSMGLDSISDGVLYTAPIAPATTTISKIYISGRLPESLANKNWFGTKNIGDIVFDSYSGAVPAKLFYSSDKSTNIINSVTVNPSCNNLSFGNYCFYQCTIGSITCETTGSLAFGEYSFASSSVNTNSPSCGFYTNGDINIGYNAFESTAISNVTFSSANGIITANKNAFKTVTVVKNEYLTFLGYNGFKVNDCADGSACFQNTTLYGDLIIESRNGSVVFNSYSFQSVTGTGNLIIKAAGDFATKGDYAIYRSKFNTIVRYKYFDGTDWEEEPCNEIDEVGFNGFRTTTCTLPVLKLTNVKSVESKGFESSAVLEPHVVINNPELKALAPLLFNLSNIVSLTIPYVETFYTPEARSDTGSSPTYGANYLAEIIAPRLVDFTANNTGTTLVKLVLGDAAYSEYVKKTLYSNYDTKNFSVYFANENTRFSFTGDISKRFLSASTDDIVACDAGFAEEYDEDGLFRINDCFIGQYLLRLNEDGTTYRIVRLHRPYEEENMYTTTPYYRSYRNLTVPHYLYGYKTENGKNVIDYTKKYEITGVEYGALQLVSIQGSLVFEEGITRFGYQELYSIKNDYNVILANDLDKITSLEFPGNSRFTYNCLYNQKFNSVTSLVFKDNSTFEDGCFSSTAFPQVTTLKFGDYSTFYASFNSVPFTNVETLDFGKNPTVSGAVFAECQFPKLKVMRVVNDGTMKKLSGTFFCSNTPYSLLEEVYIEGYDVGKSFMYRVYAPNFKKLSFVNCKLSDGYLFSNDQSYPYFNAVGLEYNLIGCTMTCALMPNFSTENLNGMKVTIKDCTITGGTSYFGKNCTLVIDNTVIQNLSINVNEGSSVSFINNCTSTGGSITSNSINGTTLDLTGLTKVRKAFVQGSWEKITIFNGEDSASYDYENDGGIITSSTVGLLVLNGAFPNTDVNENIAIYTKINNIELGSYYNGKSGLVMPKYAFRYCNFSSVDTDKFMEFFSKFGDFRGYCFYEASFPTLKSLTFDNVKLQKYCFYNNTLNFSDGSTFKLVNCSLTDNGYAYSVPFSTVTFNNLDYFIIENSNLENSTFDYVTLNVKKEICFNNLRTYSNYAPLFNNSKLNCESFKIKDSYLPQSLCYNTFNITGDFNIQGGSIKLAHTNTFNVGNSMIFSESTNVELISKQIFHCQDMILYSGAEFSSCIIDSNITMYDMISFHDNTIDTDIVLKVYNIEGLTGYQMFWNNKGTGSVTLELTSVKNAQVDNVFKNSPVISTVVFGAALESFGGSSYLFDGNNVANAREAFVIPVNSVVPAASGTFNASLTYPDEFKIYVPENLVSAYKEANEWKKVKDHIFAIPTANTDVSGNWNYVFTDEAKTSVSVYKYIGTLSDNTLEIPSTLDITEGGTARTVSVTEIGKDLLFSCFPKTVKIPSSVSYVEPLTFNGIPNLEQIIVDSDSLYLETKANGKALISKADKALVSLLSAAAGDVTLWGVQIVNSYALSGVTQVESISFPDTLVLANNAFDESAITHIYLGDKISMIGDRVFGDSLSQPVYLYINAQNPPVLLGLHSFDVREKTVINGENVYVYKVPDKVMVFVPNVNLYKRSYTWKQYASLLNTYTKSIKTVSATDTLSDLSDIHGNVYFDEFSVESGSTLFATALNGRALVSKDGSTLYALAANTKGDITLSGITTISANAFEGVTLDSLTLPDATVIGDYAFKNATIGKLVISKPVTSMGENVFSGAAISVKLINETLTLDKSVSSIDSLDLDYHGKVNTFVVASDSAAFSTGEYGKLLLSKDGGTLYAVSKNLSGDLTLDSVNEIKDYAFKNTSLNSLTASSVTKIAENAFEGSTIPIKLVGRTLYLSYTVGALNGFDCQGKADNFVVDPLSGAFDTLLDGKALVSKVGEEKILYALSTTLSGDIDLSSVNVIYPFAIKDVNVNSLTLTGVTRICSNGINNSTIGTLYAPDNPGDVIIEANAFNGSTIGDNGFVK